MTQAQDLAALGNFGSPGDYYDRTGGFYAPVNWQDSNFNGGSTLVDAQGRPWVSNDASGPAMLIVDAAHATADHPAGSMIAYNSPERRSVYRDMPQTGFVGDILTNPAFLGAIGAGVGFGTGLIGAGAEAGTVAGDGLAGLGGTGAVTGGGGELGAGLLDQAMTGYTAADASAGANALGVGTTPGIVPATSGGFSASQLTAAGIDPSLAGLSGVADAAGADVGAAIPEALKKAISSGASSSIINKMFGTNFSDADLKTLGSVLGGGIDLYGVTQRNQLLKDIADKTDAYGAPSRARYEASYQPGFDLGTADPGFKDALDYSSRANLNALSVRGNPALSPNAQFSNMSDLTSKVTLPALQNYRSTNASSGGLGTLAVSAGAAATNYANSTADPYNVAGKTVSNVLNPPSSLDDLMKQLKGYGSVFDTVRA